MVSTMRTLALSRAARVALLAALVVGWPSGIGHADDEVPPPSDDELVTEQPQPVESPVVEASSLRVARVRLTFYREAGLTYSGGRTYPGSTACSWNYPLYTAFTFRDGERVRCNDRGLLGWSGWLDVWGNSALVAKYGPWATVAVELP